MSSTKVTPAELAGLVLLARGVSEAVGAALDFLQRFNDAHGEFAEWLEIKRAPAGGAHRGFEVYLSKRYKDLLAALETIELDNRGVCRAAGARRVKKLLSCKAHRGFVRQSKAKRKEGR